MITCTKYKMLKVLQDDYRMRMEFRGFFGRRSDTVADMDFVVWHVGRYARSVEFGEIWNLNAHWLVYLYDRPINRWNIYANLANLARSDMGDYISNSNCSLAEFREIIRICGPVIFARNFPHHQLARRAKHSELREMMTAYISGCPGATATTRIPYEDIWIWLDV